MTEFRNAGRVAGCWYLLLVVLGPLRLIYIPSKLFRFDQPAETASNIASHDWLFRIGMVSELATGVVLIFLVLALYRLFHQVNRDLATQVILFGGVMPALLNLVNVVTDAGALTIVHGAPFYRLSLRRSATGSWFCSSGYMATRTLQQRSFGESGFFPWDCLCIAPASCHGS